MATENKPEVCDMLDMGCHLDTFTEWLLGFCQWMLDQVLHATVAVLKAIPVPDWMANAGSFSLPDGVLWFAGVLEIQYGAAVMVSAFTIRFLIRRLPFIG